MAFVVRYRRRARLELNACATNLGTEFLKSVESWLQDLADEAEQNEHSLSEDARDLLTALENDPKAAIPFTGWNRWLSEGIHEKIVALMIVIRDRCAPWEFRMAMQVFLIPNPVSDMPADSPAIVSAFYELDRVNRRIVVTAFPELPGWPETDAVV